ncbi:phosphatase [Candidatus Woesearchaeota archaeon]|nr:phosphatase [Candidatus Woesearchaeota archaeon]|tara:strand:+ start:7605 stop:8243 length:639 start_codon:yes stop_codon:yes gene_type:complete
MIKAVIFDMDGVIADSEVAHESAMRKVLEKHGFKLTTEDYARFCPGRTDEDGFKGIVEGNNLNIDVEDLCKEKSRLFPQIAENSIAEVNGATELIKKLHEKVKLGVASGANRDDVEMILSKLDVKKFFQITVSGDDVRFGKPDPESYLLAATKLNVYPNACLVIEDAKAGILSAKAAGMKCVALRSKYASEEDLSEADKIVNSLSEISIDEF